MPGDESAQAQMEGKISGSFLPAILPEPGCNGDFDNVAALPEAAP